MKNYLVIVILSTFTFLQSCASSNPTENEMTFWILGYKTETSNGAGKTSTLLINRSEDFSSGNWEHFYAPIQGFQFEEGIMKQIKVSTKNLDKSKVPADASTIQYTFEKEISAVTDNRINLNGNWIVTEINEQPINRMMTIPTLEIDLNKNRFSGNDGCNNYSGTLEKLTQNQIQMSTIASTNKACFKKNIASEYKKALQNIENYQFDGDRLQLINSEGKTSITFIKKIL